MAESPALVVNEDVRVHVVAGPAELARALSLLDRAEEASGVPLVDEAERDRLERRARGEGEHQERWWPLVAWTGGEPVGYGAVVLPDRGAEAAAPATGDVAVDPTSERLEPVVRALLDACAQVVSDQEAAGLQVWLRRAGEAQLRAGAAAGYREARRLGVLGRELTGDLPAAEPDGVTVRAYQPGVEDAAVVAVLADAYAGTDEAGWDLHRFRERTRLPWFRTEDLLVAELPDEDPEAPPLAGLHWLKRRDERTGEVYNLAVHPAARGRGLGTLLLRAGLRHLREQGCDEVLLWVDLVNEPAVALYTAHGFATRWLDVALETEPPAHA